LASHPTKIRCQITGTKAIQLLRMRRSSAHDNPNAFPHIDIKSPPAPPLRADKADYGQNNACPSSLSPGAHCNISVTFTPSTTGTRTADLTVVDNAQVSKQNVALTGNGSN
jgi:hypothetical protein